VNIVGDVGLERGITSTMSGYKLIIDENICDMCDSFKGYNQVFSFPVLINFYEFFIGKCSYASSWTSNV
jgi:hypothetical protein